MILLSSSNSSIKGTEILRGSILYLCLLRLAIFASVQSGRKLIISTLILGSVFSNSVSSFTGIGDNFTKNSGIDSLVTISTALADGN